MPDINLDDWILSEEEAMGTGTSEPSGIPGNPGVDTMSLGAGPVPQQGGDPNINNQTQKMDQTPKQQKIPDVDSDPKTPDMPDDMDEKGPDFESWKKHYLVESIKGDVEKLKDMLLDVRSRNLDDYQRKFVEDNLQIIFLRENANINKISKEIRKALKTELDHNNPATSIVSHMTQTINETPLVNNVFIKLTGLLGQKADLHRKFIASLIGAVQVSGGGANEDLIYNEDDYSILISTRFNAKFGDVYLGDWCLKQDDPERYLKAPELKRLQDGSPEEKDVLRRRIIMESISETFKTRAFIINVVGTDGTIYTLGWDMSSSLKTAYTEGKLIVRTTQTDSSEAMITDDGDIVPFMDLKIVYNEKTGETDENGKPEMREVDFITKKNGRLMLTAPLPIIKQASGAFQGIIFKETPWQGNPSDLVNIQRCHPNASECLLRTC